MPKGIELPQVGRHRVIGAIASVHSAQPLTLAHERTMSLPTQSVFDTFQLRSHPIAAGLTPQLKRTGPCA